MTVELTIVIVSYNAREHLRRCLQSLAAAPPALAHEIVVVDNGSPDRSAAMVREEWPALKLIEAGANLGFARANNIGIGATRSDLVLLLNSDTIVASGAIDRLVAALKAQPHAAAAGPRLVDAAGRAELSFGRMLSPFNELRQKAIVALHARRFPPVSAWVTSATRHPRFVDWVSGACLLVWREDAVAAGLLDPRYFIYAEDVDFCAALRARGRRILFTPVAEIVHLRGRSVASAPKATALAYRRSHFAFYAKHHPQWLPALKLYLRVRGKLPE